MPIVRRSGRAAPVAWPAGRRGGVRAAWALWRNRNRLEVGFRLIPGRHEAPTDENDPAGGGLIQTSGQAEGCFACASHPGRVYRAAGNGEGLVATPCPVCATRATDGPEEMTA